MTGFSTADKATASRRGSFTRDARVFPIGKGRPGHSTSPWCAENSRCTDYTYVKAHQDLMARLEREGSLIGETHDGQMRLYAERLRPQASAAWCRLHAIPAKLPTNSGEASVFHLSHNGKRWRENSTSFL